MSHDAKECRCQREDRIKALAEGARAKFVRLPGTHFFASFIRGFLLGQGLDPIKDYPRDFPEETPE